MKTLFALLLVSGAALADDAAIRQCRTLADGAGRLACYDAIALAAPAPAGTVAAAAAAVAAPAAATSAAPPTRAQQEASFGFEATLARQAKIESVESYIEGRFDGWAPNQQIRLANGQVWRVVDGSEGVTNLNNPKVTVVRGSLGSIFLEIDGTNRSPKVRRVQ